MDYVIRKYEKEDFIKMVDLSNDEWKDTINQTASTLFYSTNDVECCYIAEIESKIIGFIYAFILPNKTLIPEFLYVLPQFRKKGVGKDLLKSLEVNSGCQSSIIYYNKTLHSYYQSQGYVVGENLEVALKQIPGVSQ